MAHFFHLQQKVPFHSFFSLTLLPLLPLLYPYLFLLFFFLTSFSHSVSLFNNLYGYMHLLFPLSYIIFIHSVLLIMSYSHIVIFLFHTQPYSTTPLLCLSFLSVSRSFPPSHTSLSNSFFFVTHHFCPSLHANIFVISSIHLFCKTYHIFSSSLLTFFFKFFFHLSLASLTTDVPFIQDALC